MTKTYIILGVVAIILLIIVYRYIVMSINKFKENYNLKKRIKRGNTKEKAALKVLKRSGYKILGNNIAYSYYLKEDKRKHKISIEIDYLVSKNNKTYIVEVKSGNMSTKITNSSTRRQILEYYTFIENDGIFLLDMETEELKEIIFPKFKVREFI